MNPGDKLECIDDIITGGNKSKYITKGQIYTLRGIDNTRNNDLILEECPKGRFDPRRFKVLTTVSKSSPMSDFKEIPSELISPIYKHSGHEVVKNHVLTMKGIEHFSYCRTCKVEVI